MIPDFAQCFTYRINWRSRSHHAGYHRGVQNGLGVEFRGNVPLVDYPDARRIDLRESIRDPGEQVHVRIFNQKTATPVYAICDLSGSMAFGAKIPLIAEIAASIAYSVYQSADTFGFLGFDDAAREDWYTAPSYRMHDAFELVSRLKDYVPAQSGCAGLLEVGRYLSPTRALVFLVSDFHMPLELLEQALNMLSRHHVVPIVLWNTAEYLKLPGFGLETIVDAETGRQRMLFFRNSLKQRFNQAFAERREALEALFLRYETPPCFVEDRFDAQTLSDYFHLLSPL